MEWTYIALQLNPSMSLFFWTVKAKEHSDKVSPLVAFDKPNTPPTKLDTPSKGNGKNSILDKEAVWVELSSKPLVVEVDEDFENPYSKFQSAVEKEDLDGASHGQSLDVLLAERTYYPAGSLAPQWIDTLERRPGASMNREALFPTTHGKRKFFEFAKFEPELFTTVTETERPSPAFNGEIKCAGTGKTMWDEIATYVLFSIIHSFFEKNQGEDKTHYFGTKRIFYDAIPVGYGLMGMANVGFFVCMEVVGKAFITPCTKPFFIGSKDHQEVVNNLPKFEGKYQNVFTLDCTEKIFEQCDKLKEKSVVTKKPTKDGQFWKVIRYNAFPPSYFRRLHFVYSRYKALSPEELQNHHLLPAELLYGELEVSIRTEFLSGYRPGRTTDMESTETMTKIAKAIAYLAESKLLYTDLRPENFMIKDVVEKKSRQIREWVKGI